MKWVGGWDMTIMSYMTTVVVPFPPLNKSPYKTNHIKDYVLYTAMMMMMMIDLFHDSRQGFGKCVYVIQCNRRISSMSGRKTKIGNGEC